jgi:hypothetical protein
MAPAASCSALRTSALGHQRSSRPANGLLQFRAGALHDVGPFRRFFLDQGRELLRRPPGRFVADLLIARFEEVRVNSAVNVGVELVDDRARRAGWRCDAEPYRCFITGNTSLSDCRQVGEGGRTL